MEQYQSYNADIKAMGKLVEKEGKDREDMIDVLDGVAGEAQDIQMTIEKARERL